MSFRIMLSKLTEYLTGIKKYPEFKRGSDFASEIRKALPKFRVEIVFDVGANEGQSAKMFLAQFPNSHIYCVEPVSKTYQRLKHNFKNNNRVNCYQLAFGSSKRTGEMVLQGTSRMFFLQNQSASIPAERGATESVNVDTLDNFCSMNGIDHINFLKTDTEGGDLEVLMGAGEMLSQQRIDIIQVEAGMNPSNSRHASLESIKEFCESYKYYLFGIYEQVSEWPAGEPHLRRANPIFISQRIIEKNRI